MRWLTIAVALTALVLVGAGCGGGDDEASGTDTAVITDTTDTDETTTDETTDETTTDETTDTDVDVSGVFADEDCLGLVNASAALGQAFAAAGDSGDLDETAEVFDELASKVPDEIKDDFQVLADAYDEYVAVLADVDLQPGETPSAAQIAQLTQALSAIDQQAVTEASNNISAWTTENC